MLTNVDVTHVTQELANSEIEFSRLYKCLNKTLLPKKATVEEHLRNIITEYNKIKSIYIKFYNLLDHHNQIYLENLLAKSQKHLRKIFKRLNSNIQIAPIELSNPDDTVNSSVNLSVINNDMALTEIDFCNFATKTIPEFNGKPEELQRFIDALNLVKKNVTTFLGSAIEVIKTKLIGTARNYITNEDTIEAIILTLRANIKPESPQLIISKLNQLKQGNKTPNAYITEIEALTTSLKRAYITEGISVDIAERYTTQNALQSIKSNSTNEKVNIILEAGNFTTVTELSTKFLSVSNKQFKSQPNYLFPKEI